MRVDIKLSSEEITRFISAMKMLEQFNSNYPERVGRRNGVVYSSNHISLVIYIYRSEAGTLVIREC